jgi:hypothetical protein
MSYGGPNISCEWSAWYNRMPGTDDPNLHVSGRCTLPSGSIEIALAPGNEGTVNEPDLFVLEATVKVPDVGTDDVVEREVTWEGDAGPDIKRVRIQGDLEADIEVEEAV